jgi:hypothetical protein
MRQLIQELHRLAQAKMRLIEQQKKLLALLDQVYLMHDEYDFDLMLVEIFYEQV